MTGTDGINTLGRLLGSLKESNVNAGKTDGAIGSVGAAGTSRPGGTVVSPSQPQAADQANLSAAAGLASDVSDVRTEKVTQIRNAIANGTYSVPASAVADKLVESLLEQ